MVMRTGKIGLIFAAISLACVGAPPPPPGGGGSGASSTGSSETTTSIFGTTVIAEDSTSTVVGSSSGSSSTSTTTDGGSTESETTMGVGPATSDTSSGESSSGPLPPHMCLNDGECGANEICNPMGECEAACIPWGPNEYAYCLTPLGTFNSAVLCGEPFTCINSMGTNGIEVVVCGRTCAARCDCPAPPATGTAIVTCGEVIMGGSNECYLSCASGEACPDGMVCRNGNDGTPLYCTHPVQPSAPYGNCDNIAAGCVAGFTCSNIGSNSVCTELCPGGIGDCDAPPAGSDLGVGCENAVSPPAGDDCFIQCNSNTDCPDGMSCVDNGVGNQLCMWP